MTRRTTLALSAAISGGIALASLVAAAPAQAETATHQDKTGDVAVLTPGGKAKYDTLDITDYKNAYAKGKLTLTTSVVDLATSGWEIDWYVQDQDGNLYRGGVAGTDDGLLSVFGTADPTTLCEDAKPSTKGDSVTLKVPVSCLGEAASVSIANYSIAPKGQTQIVADDANRGKLKDGQAPRFADPIAYN